MLCDVCKKNEATIHIKEMHGGETHTANLCAACASEKEKNGELSALGFNLAEMLCNLGKISSSAKPPQDGRAALEAELDNRRHELDALVKREEYEEAAVCRDRINQLKTQLEGLATGEVGND